jgi:hypothetical protein
MRALHCYFAADSSSFRDKEPSRKPLCISAQSQVFFGSITWTWADSGYQLHDGIAVHQDSVRGFNCIVVWLHNGMVVH